LPIDSFEKSAEFLPGKHLLLEIKRRLSGSVDKKNFHRHQRDLNSSPQKQAKFNAVKKSILPSDESMKIDIEAKNYLFGFLDYMNYPKNTIFSIDGF